ncbi:hypothetical protein ACFDTO_32430 [Microbacteriaceae bacterium 4G12]
MRYVQVSSKTYRDNTGRSVDFPTLLVEYNGETMLFEQLHRYQIKNRSKSRTWHKKKEIQKPSPKIKYISSYGKGLRIQERTMN